MRKTYTGNEGLRDTNSELVYGLAVRNTILQQAITVGVTAAALPTAALSRRISLEIFNNSTSGQILYIGDSTVTTANGLPIYPRASYTIYIEDNVEVYGIASAAGANIRIAEGA